MSAKPCVGKLQISLDLLKFLPPTTKLGQGNIFRSVCQHSVQRGGMRGCSGGACMVAPGGACMVAPWGHAWLLSGSMHGYSGGHAWLLQGVGGVHDCSQGCVWLLWGVHVWLLWGACMVALGRHAWLLPGGVHGCSRGSMCGCFQRSMRGTRYGDTVNEGVVCILLECILVGL